MTATGSGLTSRAPARLMLLRAAARAAPRRPLVRTFATEKEIAMRIAALRTAAADRGKRVLLWATDLEHDSGEQVNLITADRRAWRRDASWKALVHEGRQYLKHRRRRDWRVLTVEEVG